MTTNSIQIKPIQDSVVEKTCYMCECIATSKEHAPPKCIFPEKNDAGGVDYRKNLIKVPSCDKHNTEKSTDDEYLMYVLPTSIAANNTGTNQFLTKVQRAIDRNPSLAVNLSKNAQRVIVHDTEKDAWFEAPAIQIDLERVHKVIEMNARAIFYNLRNEKFLGSIEVYTNFSLQLDAPEINDMHEKLFSMSECLLQNSELRGENQDVFAYKIERDGDIELIEFTFYGTSKALAVLQYS
jgi:hypothetical protein